MDTIVIGIKRMVAVGFDDRRVAPGDGHRDAGAAAAGARRAAMQRWFVKGLVETEK
jgi:hypothetical protein